MPTEQRLTQVFIELADTMVNGFDVLDFLHTLTGRCIELLAVDEAAILLTDQRDELRVVAASSEQARLLVELFQRQHGEGPCLECYRSGQPVSDPDLAHGPQRWVHFNAAATASGFHSITVLPMRLREQVIGTVTLLGRAPGRLDELSVGLGQALADVATIGLLHERAVREGELLAEQLQTALNSRIVIEQAKGVLAERRGLSMDQAFTALRNQARAHNHKLVEVAYAVVHGAAEVTELP